MESKHIRESSRRFYARHWKEFLPSIFSLITVAIIAVLPGFFIPALLYVTLILLYLPCVLGTHLCINMIESGHPVPATMTLQGIPAFFSRSYAGSYRSLIGFAKSVVVGFLGLFLVSIVYALVASAVDPAFNDIINQIADLSLSGDVDSMTVLLQDPTVTRYMTTCHIAITVASLAMALRHLQVHELNVSVRSHLQSGEGRGMNQFFLTWYQSYKGEARSMIAHPTWFSFLILAFGYILGMIIGFLIFGYDVEMVAFGVLFALIGLSIYMPYYCRYCNMVSFAYSISMQENALVWAQNDLETLRQRGAIDQSQYEEMKKQLEAAREKVQQEKVDMPDRYPFED